MSPRPTGPPPAAHLLLLLGPLLLQLGLVHDCGAISAADLLSDSLYSEQRQQQQQQQQQRRNLEFALKRGGIGALASSSSSRLLFPEETIMLGSGRLLQPMDSRERRAAAAAGASSSSSGMGSNFIRFGRGGGGVRGSQVGAGSSSQADNSGPAVVQPHLRSDSFIRYGRDGLQNRLNRLRQERRRRLARLALICAAKSQEDVAPSSAEEKILREICKDAPLHPTVPDFV